MRNLCPNHIGPCDCRNAHGLPYRQPPHPIECERVPAVLTSLGTPLIDELAVTLRNIRQAYQLDDKTLMQVNWVLRQAEPHCVHYRETAASHG